MASINNKASVLAVKKEVTEGVLVNPSASTDYVALQEGFSFAPQFEELTSAELKNSIGAGETVLGSENPTASFDHYIRHSGVEGQEPDYGEILESVFGGKSVAASEYSTISGSTTSESLARTSCTRSGCVLWIVHWISLTVSESLILAP